MRNPHLSFARRDVADGFGWRSGGLLAPPQGVVCALLLGFGGPDCSWRVLPSSCSLQLRPTEGLLPLCLASLELPRRTPCGEAEAVRGAEGTGLKSGYEGECKWGRSGELFGSHSPVLSFSYSQF